ncbi:MAG TPA: metallophosphoesterase, partial [Janthinobacterium sp.]|nr:metallophosphoesterase [Janthinobacterium sp.]
MRARYCLPFLPLLIGACAALGDGQPRPATPIGSTAVLAVLETTDVHSNVLGYDYFKLAPDASLGLERTATLIARARAEYANTLLLDDGDTIQGTALADYQALVEPLTCDQTLAVYKVMNKLGVEGGTIGNHEFNYGLPYLNQVTGSRFQVDGVDATKPRCAGPAFPLVLANVYSAKTRQPLFAPYRILDKQVAATGPDGQPVTATLRVGIIGFTTPTILAWDKRWLDGKIYTEGLRETAQKYIPEMRARGADLVIALSHGGLDKDPYSPAMENGSYYLAQVPGIDAMLIGHAHQLFPNAASTAPQFSLPGVDQARGLVNGVPTVMANFWGKNLGLIGLHLRFDGKAWVVEKDKTIVEQRAIQNADQRFVAADPAIAGLIAAEHAATIRYVQTPVGKTDFRMSSYF